MTSTSPGREIVRAQRVATDEYPASNLRFDLLVMLCGCWLIGGLYLDGWAHNQPNLVDTFFTPWHAVLYSGFLAVATAIGGMQLRSMLRGHSILRALPRGYWASLVGVMLFGFGGGFDVVWHSVFGFEANIDALISPAHLLLATGAFLFLTGPLRAAWIRARTTPQHGWAMLLPAVVSLFLVYAAFTFFTQYAHPLGNPHLLVRRVNVETYFISLQVIISTLIPSAILMGTLLVGMRSLRLPFGTITLLLGGTMVLMFLMRYRTAQNFGFVPPVAVVVGLLADGALWRWQPSAQRVVALRIFGFALPFTLFSAYYVSLLLAKGLVITAHMWMGASMLAGFVGLFMSYVFVQPQFERM